MIYNVSDIYQSDFLYLILSIYVIIYEQYCKTSSINRTKSTNLNVSCLALYVVSAQSIEARC